MAVQISKVKGQITKAKNKNEEFFRLEKELDKKGATNMQK